MTSTSVRVIQERWAELPREDRICACVAAPLWVPILAIGLVLGGLIAGLFIVGELLLGPEEYQ